MASVGTTPRLNPVPNSVQSLIQEPFEERSLADKREVIDLGPDQPDLVIEQHQADKGKTYMRGFSRIWYTRKAWLAGCTHANALFCFPCLIFKTTRGTDVTWTTTGVRDMKHLSEKSRKHENTRAHMDNAMKLATLGRVDIATQMDDGHWIALRTHNEELSREGFETSVRKTPDEPSPPLPVSVRDSMRNNLKKKLNSIVDSLLKSAVSEITDALDASVFDHEMVMKEKIEELRIKLEKAEKKLRKRKRKQDVNHTSEQMIPEITVEVPDDWCAPLGCENVAVQTPSTSFMDKAQQSSSLGSLSVSLWLLPDIKQEIKKEVQHDGYQIDGSLSGPCQEESPQRRLEHTEDQKPPSTPKHRTPRRLPQHRKESTKANPGQPIHMPKICNKRVLCIENVETEVKHTIKGNPKRKRMLLPAIQSEPDGRMEETTKDKIVSFEEQQCELAAITSNEKQCELGDVSSEEQQCESGDVISEEKQCASDVSSKGLFG